MKSVIEGIEKDKMRRKADEEKEMQNRVQATLGRQ